MLYNDKDPVWSDNIINSDDFMIHFRKYMDIDYLLIPKQFYFYLYHQFYTMISLGPFDTEKQRFSIKLDDNCRNHIYTDILIFNPNRLEMHFPMILRIFYHHILMALNFINSGKNYNKK